MVRRPALVILGLALLAVAPPGALAAKPKGQKLLKPSVKSSFAGSEPIVVRWKTDRALPKGVGYKVTLITGGSPDRDGPPCSTPQLVRRVGAGTPRGRALVVRLPVPRSGWWCPSRQASVSVEAPGVIGVASFSLRNERGLVPPEGYMWGRMTFAPPSSITVRVPGRPDRTAPLAAQIDQDSYSDPRNPYRTTGDSVWVNASGTMTPGALAADPLCTAAPITPIPVDRATTLLVPGVHAPPRPLELMLILRTGAAGLTGCAPDGPQTGVTAVLLKSDPNATGAGALRLSGSLDGVRLSGGGVAMVAFDVMLANLPAPLPASQG